MWSAGRFMGIFLFCVSGVLTSPKPYGFQVKELATCTSPYKEQYLTACLRPDNTVYMGTYGGTVRVADSFNRPCQLREAKSYRKQLSDVTCSPDGDVYVAFGDTDDNSIEILHSDGTEETWKNSDFVNMFVLSMAVNKNYIALVVANKGVTSRELLLYDRQRVLKGRFSDMGYMYAYLSPANFLWTMNIDYINQTVPAVKAYNVVTHKVTYALANKYLCTEISGTGDFVFFGIEDTDIEGGACKIYVYHQNGTFSHFLKQNGLSSGNGPLTVSSGDTTIMAVVDDGYKYHLYRLQS